MEENPPAGFETRLSRLEIRVDESRERLTELEVQVAASMREINEKLDMLLQRDTRRAAISSALIGIWKSVIIPLGSLVIAAAGYLLRPVLDHLANNPPH